MTRSRKIFVTAAVLFAGFLIFIIVDISRRTTFPGSHKTDQKAHVDSLKGDSSANSSIRPR